RRADGQPRSRHLGRDHAAPLPHQSRRHDDRDGDARSRDGGQDAAPRDCPRGRAPCPRRAPRGLRLVGARFKLLLSEAVRSLGANVSTTAAATMTVLIGMFLLGFLIGLSTWAFSLSNHYKRELVVKVYFNHGVADSGKEVNAVRAKLAANPLVKSVKPVTAEQGL